MIGSTSCIIIIIIIIITIIIYIRGYKCNSDY
jgi:hypothetical protein